MKKYIKKNWPLGLTNLILIVFVIVLTVLALTSLDNIFEQFFGYTDHYLVGNTGDYDVNYVESKFDSVEELYAYEEAKCAEIAQDELIVACEIGVVGAAFLEMLTLAALTTGGGEDSIVVAPSGSCTFVFCEGFVALVARFRVCPHG